MIQDYERGGKDAGGPEKQGGQQGDGWGDGTKDEWRGRARENKVGCAGTGQVAMSTSESLSVINFTHERHLRHLLLVSGLTTSTRRDVVQRPQTRCHPRVATLVPRR